MVEKGPVYGVELIGDLPLNGSMRQAMPTRKDLESVLKVNQRVVAGYEILLGHYQNLQDDLESLQEQHSNFEAKYHPELFARFHEAMDAIVFEGEDLEFADPVVREVLDLPKTDLAMFVVELAFATKDRTQALYRLGVLTGAMSRLSEQ